MLQRKIFAGIGLALLLGSSPVYAAPFPSLANDVGVCDPNNPSHCIAPDASGNVPITGTITASLGGFTPSASGARGTPLSVTTSDSSGTLPTGAVTIVSNAGTTNPMYCNVNGVAATTSDQLIGANSWFAFTIPAAITTLHCIATGGTTTANMLGGAGLATGAGGGSGGSGGGGVVTNAGTFAVQLTGATNNINNIAGTISLPTGAATAAGLTTINTTLGSPMQNSGGSVTANAGTNLNTSLLATQATLASVLTATPTITSWAGGTLGAMANYGTSPGAVLVPGANVFVTNTNANGQATAANSSPVVLPVAQVTADPCSLGAKTNLPISQNGTASVQLVALSGATSIYVCSLSLIAAGATTVALTTGTGSACVTGNAAVIGTTTASIANSMSLAANGGLTLGNGAGTIAKGAASSELCMVLGTSVFVSGNLTYVQL